MASLGRHSSPADQSHGVFIYILVAPLDSALLHTWPCNSSGGYSLTSHLGDPGSIRGKVMWDFWWTNWHSGRCLFEYFNFPCQFSFHRLLHTHHLSSEAGTIGQILPDVPSGLSLTPPPRNLKKLFHISL
jgi:hypothetical protein